jgi:Fe2+ transport system protein FeoA
MSDNNSDTISALADAPAGSRVRIRRIHAGRGLRDRLSAMGMVPDEVVKIEKNGSGGPLMLRIKGVRVVLGREACRKIDIERLGT